MPDILILFNRFGLALAFGLMIGVEREREKGGGFAGIRTFPLISLTGCAAAMIEGMFIPWTFAACLAGIVAMILRVWRNQPGESQGMTTEVAAIAAYLLGGMAWWDMGRLGAALAVVIVLLLSSKRTMEDFTLKIGHAEIMAAVQFGVITLIILQVLPDKGYGPFEALNPFKIWLVVVLISTVNLVGYAFTRILGTDKGIEVTGMVGGFLSSTLVTVSLSRRSRIEPAASRSFAVAIILASTIMFLRVLFVVFSLNPSVARQLITPFVAATVAGFLSCAIIHSLKRDSSKANSLPAETTEKNPLELWQAIKFTLLFAGILLLSKAATHYFDKTGLYVISAVTGTTDVDAITISLASLVNQGGILPGVAATAITMAIVGNTVTKMLIAMFTGPKALSSKTTPVFLLMGAIPVLTIYLLRITARS
jgi:uncharacterized membrane protein (DUF4010 family)